MTRNRAIAKYLRAPAAAPLDKDRSPVAIARPKDGITEYEMYGM